MALTLNKIITRNSGNTIDVSTSYSELNTKAQGIINDIVANTEANAAAQEAFINTAESTLTSSINALVNPSATGYTTEASDVRHTALSKATFEAIARDNRDKFAGSGFVEFGKVLAGIPTYLVNDGIWTLSTYSNYFVMGRYGGSGTSKTDYPLLNINGNRLSINSINSGTQNNIQLPTAPTVYPFGTTNHLITEGLAIAHADASNSGLIVNGKFDTDTIWTKGTGWTIGGGVATIAGTGTSFLTNTQYIFIAGRKYIIEFEVTRFVSGGARLYLDGTGYIANATTGGRFSIEFTPTVNNSTLKFVASSGDDLDISSIAVFPADAISRSDLVFLESWHEDTSEKGVLFD